MVAMSDEDVEQVLKNIPEACTLVGAQALSLWMRIFGIEFDEIGVPVTKDIDLLGPPSALYDIQKSWGGTVHLIHESSLSALFGQVHKRISNGTTDYQNVDVIHQVFGLRKSDILKDRVALKYDDHQFFVLHPLHVMEARIKNLKGIPDKKTEHGAFQTKAAIKVANAYLSRLCIKQHLEPTAQQRRDLLRRLNEMSRLACSHTLQGTAKAWGIDLLDIFPLAQIPIPEFLEHQWPRLQAKADSISPSRFEGPTPRLNSVKRPKP